MNKNIFYAIVGGALAVGLVLVGYFLHGNTEVVATTSSPAGVTNSSARFDSITMAPLASTATSSSILNTSANDREIESMVVTCQNVGTSLAPYTTGGIAALHVTMATTSTAAPANNPNTNTLVLTVSTTTPDQYNYTGQATSTTAVNRVWAAGSNASFFWDATNTAACTVGLHTIAL